MANRRKRTLLLFLAAALLLTGIGMAGYFCHGAAGVTDFSRKNSAPCLEYPFGTDWMGRDMFTRTLAGLSLSLRIGLLTAGISACLALVLGTAAAVSGRRVDACISFVIDAVMGIPHILLLLLISYACGRGMRGVVVGVALTHWPSLARLIRGEVLQLKESEYIRTAAKLGTGRIQIAVRHMLPHLFPQFAVGLVLMFPHAILHEASITFLGFGLPSEEPAIGVILSESMRYLITGNWWLALFPGLMLVMTVMLFYAVGNALQKLLDPSSAQE
ncbi:MAG TPA: ABC transporter permease [Candidatus Eisenbergiella merdipullorum]|uniref:ABC transporter permease n=1 Tax=Candidatus Eisenbergiella merdipullorum TaxID=2838553 RepID=A0A9D2I7B5_9FIRM|nr:ABC transporter permease [Candidatus Eisenbergiella merdipullorum]